LSTSPDHIAALYKYCSIHTALKILHSQALRWSAPHLHNDPFQCDFQSELNFTQSSLLAALIKRAEAMLFGPEKPDLKRHGNNQLAATIIRWREEQRFDNSDEATVILKQQLSPIAASQMQQATKLVVKWQQFARLERLCCLSNKPDLLACWQRFGDEHRGVVLRFSCGEGTALKQPQAVRYQQHRANITSLKQQLDVAFGLAQPSSPEDFQALLLSKNKQQQEEQEWRCFSADPATEEEPDLWYSTRDFAAQELEAVAFGLNTPRAERQQIRQLVKVKFPTARLLQAERVDGRYALVFVADCG
jgi:hypothetical protein